MYCYSHETVHAVGICKTCGRAVCRSCALDLGFAICCSSTCEDEARQLNEMNQRGKKIYGIGSSEKRSSSQATAYFILGVSFTGFGFIFFQKIPMLTYFTVAMGLLMVVVGFFIRQRMKNLGIQM